MHDFALSHVLSISPFALLQIILPDRFRLLFQAPQISVAPYESTFLGDIMGRAGRQAVIEHLPALRSKGRFDLIIVNGENATSSEFD